MNASRDYAATAVRLGSHAAIFAAERVTAKASGCRMKRAAGPWLRRPASVTGAVLAAETRLGYPEPG